MLNAPDEHHVDVSVVVPLFNEQDCIEPLISAIHRSMDPTGLSYEIVLVDDGSTDDTFALLEQRVVTDARLVVVKFRRNFGQTPAMAAGMQVARGDTLVTMDGDLQNDPSDIPRFLQGIDSGYDLVVGWRQNRQDKLVTRKIPSVIANWLIGKITGVPIKDNGCSLKAYRAGVFKRIPLYSDMHRFIPAVSSLAGIAYEEIPVKHHARKFGHSKYGLSRIYKVLLDLLAIRTLLTCARRPLVFFLGLAAWSALLGAVFFVGALATNLDFGITGTSFLYFNLALLLSFWGMLATLLIGSGDAEIRQLSVAAQVERTRGKHR